MPQKKKRKSSHPLSSKVEQLSDGKDKKPQAHVDHFMSHFKDGLYLPDIDLTSIEGALKAQRILAEQSAVLDQKISTLRALKKLNGS